MSEKLRAEFSLPEREWWGREGGGEHGVRRHCCCLQLPNKKVYREDKVRLISSSCSRTRANGHMLQEEKFQLALLCCDSSLRLEQVAQRDCASSLPKQSPEHVMLPYPALSRELDFQMPLLNYMRLKF